MKKIFLIVLLLLTLCACTEKETEQSQKTEKPQKETTANSETVNTDRAERGEEQPSAITMPEDVLVPSESGETPADEIPVTPNGTDQSQGQNGNQQNGKEQSGKEQDTPWGGEDVELPPDSSIGSGERLPEFEIS